MKQLQLGWDCRRTLRVRRSTARHSAGRGDRLDGLEPRLWGGWTDIYFLIVELRVVAISYLSSGQLIAVWVHGGQDVDTRGVDEHLDALVPQQVLGAQVLRQVDEKLPPQNLITMHVTHVLHLWLH